MLICDLTDLTTEVVIKKDQNYMESFENSEIYIDRL